jgi:HD-GYP domain-containing protein (c-di-GMP phosphodiesterase class II)
VVTKAGTLDLLASGHGVEVVRGSLKSGERLNFVPAEAGMPSTHEVCMLIDGVLVAPDALGAQRLSTGSLITSEGLLEPVGFMAEGDVRFVYITSSPMFHHISHDMNELRQLAVDIEVTDGYTADHCERLQRLSYATGRELGLSASQLYALDFGAYLHDVGKVRVPPSILTKPGALDADEWAVIKKHPTFGREILAPTFMRGAGTIVEQHHERSDGSGYPYGLTEPEILVESAIVAVADTYDAMTTDRPYRRGRSQAEAFAELASLAGTHHPPEVIRAFRSAVALIER